MLFIFQFFVIFLGILDSLLAARFILIFFRISLFPVTGWLYSFTEPLILPFGNFIPAFNFFGFYFETPTLLAIIFFSILSAIVSELNKSLISTEQKKNSR